MAERSGGWLCLNNAPAAPDGIDYSRELGRRGTKLWNKNPLIRGSGGKFRQQYVPKFGEVYHAPPDYCPHPAG